jgi:hypothetical protein
MPVDLSAEKENCGVEIIKNAGKKESAILQKGIQAGFVAMRILGNRTIVCLYRLQVFYNLTPTAGILPFPGLKLSPTPTLMPQLLFFEEAPTYLCRLQGHRNANPVYLAEF